jgi:HPt (histidine-containing phosphotransfer) domain-containing protein
MFIERNGYAMSAQPITSEWMERMRGKQDFVERLFTVFVTEEPKRLERIREALGREDAEAMAYLTHSL